MPKKKKLIKKVEPTKLVYKEITQEEFLENLIETSKKAISPHGSSVDSFFKGQVARLERELKILRESKK